MAWGTEAHFALLSFLICGHVRPVDAAVMFRTISTGVRPENLDSTCEGCADQYKIPGCRRTAAIIFELAAPSLPPGSARERRAPLAQQIVTPMGNFFAPDAFVCRTGVGALLEEAGGDRSHGAACRISWPTRRATEEQQPRTLVVAQTMR